MVFIYNKLVKNERGDMENSFMTHQDDREDYSVVHAKTPLIGFSYNKDGINPLRCTSVGKKPVMVTISHSFDNWIQ